MKKTFFLIPFLSLALVGCNRQDKTIAEDSDNTGVNVRDRDERAVTPFNQSENEQDRAITQKIRQMVIADEGLSLNAKNIKIITIDGVVTLRGPVANAREKEAIASKIENVKGIKRVNNQLEVTRNNH